MTELQCWPLDGKEYTSVDLGAAYAARSRGLLTAQSFTATTNGDNTLTLSKGLGCLHVSEFWAAFPYLLNSTVLQFEDADGVYPRWDAAVLGYDKNANMAGLYVRTGLAAPSPTLPELRRDNDFDEIFLYRVTRPVGAIKIEDEHIVDLRLDPTYCGLMRDTIDAIDTRVMQAAFEAFLNKIEQELNDLNAGTSTMQRITYDPQGKNQDIFAYPAHLYKATFLVDGWSGDGPYTQTVSVQAVDGGPVITSASHMTSGLFCDDTVQGDAQEALLEAAALVDKGKKTFGSGTITCVLENEKPEADAEVYFNAKKGGA